MTRFTDPRWRIAGGIALVAAIAACDSGSTLTAPGDAARSPADAPAQVTPVEIDAVFSGPPNREPNNVSLADPSLFVQILDVEQYLGRSASAGDVRIGDDWATGTPAENFEILDLNQDGNRDIQLRWSIPDLIDDGHLGENTTEITVWGVDPTTGDEFSGTAEITIIEGGSGSLGTAPANNGSGGVFMDLTPTRTLRVTSFEAPFGGAAGTIAEVEVWTRPGSYVGFDGSADGWTLTQTVEAERAGTAVNAPIVLSEVITLPADQTTAVYLHVVSGTLGQGLRYTGTAGSPPQTTWSNDDLTLFSDVARTGTTPFAGSRFEPRTFSGVVNYAFD
jgi:hypothetical protein